MITQELPSTTATGERAVVPVIDISAFLAGLPEGADVVSAVGRACEEIGFMVITGHGVPADLIARMYDVTERFFDLPTEVKERWASPTGNVYRGYAGITSFGNGAAAPDLCEGFEIARFDDVADVLAAGYGEEWTAGFDPNIWPDQPAGMRAVWREYYAAMEMLAARIMRIFAVALDLPATWFDDKFDRHTSYMSANRYPAQLVPPQEGQTRRSAHTDIGSLTILYQDGAPGGLQVLDREGRWCDVPPVGESFVINLGDMLAKWTNDRWVATQHRVVNPPPEFSARQRISIPFFHHPNFDALLECIPSCSSADNPPKYDAVLGGNWSKYRMALGF